MSEIQDITAPAPGVPRQFRDSERASYIKGLREIAAFLEAHPELPVPYACNHLAAAPDKDAVAAVARVTGVRWQKDWTSNEYFTLKTEFSGRHSYDVYIQRAAVCRKEILGTRIEPAQPERVVEDFRWICDEPALLAGDR